MIKEAYILVKPFFKGQLRVYARLGGLLILALSLSQVLLTYMFNSWRGRFYDAIQAYDWPVFTRELLYFSLLAAAAIVLYTMTNFIIQRYTLTWRKWKTETFLEQWRLRTHREIFIDNPDQRIQEDIMLFTDLISRLFTGFMAAILTLGVFTPILWSLSEKVVFLGYNVSGGLWWASLIFTVAGGGFCFWLGNRLAPTQYNNQRLEADFRYSLVKFRKHEYDGISPPLNKFAILVDNYKLLYHQFKVFGFSSSTYFQIAIILPFLLAAPSFFAHALTLGTLMQIANAFDVVNSSMSYLLDRWLDITKLKSVTSRLYEFSQEVK